MDAKDELIKKWAANGIVTDPKVIEAFRKVPREKFIKEKLDEAYGDYPLPIGSEQTISQPTTVMVMTEALELKEGDKVLEVGSGSGYQAALIGEIVGDKGKVITTEIIKELYDFSLNNMKKLNIKNIKLLNVDGSKGFEKEAPYDKIIVTAACPKIPKPLVEQLKENGIIIAPVGNMVDQVMIKAKKVENELIEEKLGQFIFVPMKGKYGY